MINRLILSTIILLFSWSSGYAAEARVDTRLQDTIRSSYPFPDFLSTGPYVWYEDAEDDLVKGHTYRLATFTVDGAYRLYLEKVNFGDHGCCLEIVNYRELLINAQVLGRLFPRNEGADSFRLIRWVSPDSFTFSAYGGRYHLSEISQTQPQIRELPKS